MLLSSLKRTLLAIGMLALLAPYVAGAATDKELQRQRGSVSYRDTGGTVHPVSGQIALADDAYAITGRASAALLSLPDSSEVSLGENTSIKVGKFNGGATGPGNTITVDGGALKFAIRHPSGSKSNYTFTTPTSQIAVRGTEGYLVVGPRGTQVVCTRCEPGDVTVRTIAGVVTAIVTGQVLLVSSTGSAAAGSVAALNNPAVNQFSNGLNPFGNSAESIDATGSASGATAGAAGAAGASVGAIAGGAAAAGAAVAVTQAQSTNQSPPAPPPPSVTPSSFNFNAVNQTQSFIVNGASSFTATSLNPAVAMVTSSSGNSFTVKAIAIGSTGITVNVGGSSITVTVTVAGTVVTPQGIHL